jgi:hypothetical protein
VPPVPNTPVDVLVLLKHQQMCWVPSPRDGTQMWSNFHRWWKKLWYTDLCVYKQYSLAKQNNFLFLCKHVVVSCI